mmetsp:Transcript_76605/g.222461  ORF Transcript_76605/g.222461 Transcript_76605/m.222461 type:complete len:140 (+) Transcript_76605:88-507(+)
MTPDAAAMYAPNGASPPSPKSSQVSAHLAGKGGVGVRPTSAPLQGAGALVRQYPSATPPAVMAEHSPGKRRAGERRAEAFHAGAAGVMQWSRCVSMPDCEPKVVRRPIRHLERRRSLSTAGGAAPRRLSATSSALLGGP